MPVPSPSCAIPDTSSSVEITAELAPTTSTPYRRAASIQYRKPSPAEESWLMTRAYALT